MAFFAGFTDRQRAMTLAGIAPVLLFGCAIPDRIIPVGVAAPAPTVGAVAVPVPPPPPPPPSAPRPLVSQIEQLQRQFNGRVGVAVRRIDQGWTVAAGGERLYPQQSVSKLWVAMTVLEQRDLGRIRFEDPITVTHSDLTLFHQPIAALAVRPGGYRTTVEDLLRRAITQSDNTANDRLLRLAGGPEAVRSFIRRKALGQIRFSDGERLMQSSIAGMEWRQEYSLGRAFYEARAKVPAARRRAAFEAYVADPIDGASPLAIVDALTRLKEGNLLSAGSTSWLVTTMQSTRTGRARVRAAVPQGWLWGHKTGTGQDLPPRTAGFNDIGILTAPDGASYAVAILIGDTPRPPRERQELMQAVTTSIVASHR